MEPFEEHLKNLWTEGTRDIAVAFLQRALQPNSSLAELRAALQFEGVRPYLSTIRLSDVLAQAKVRPAPTAPTATAASAARRPRRRRSAAQMAQMREAIVALLSESPESLNTTQICADLSKRGHGVDTMRVNLLLKGLLKEGAVRDLGGKPKAWRLLRT
jgi:hypothetical protein